MCAQWSVDAGSQLSHSQRADPPDRTHHFGQVDARVTVGVPEKCLSLFHQTCLGVQCNTTRLVKSNIIQFHIFY